MKKDKQKSDFINIGSSSLLVIFFILCMAAFAVLSLSSAQSDHSFSERLAQHKTVYYKACAQAETITETIDQTLFETAESAGTAGLGGSKDAFIHSAYAKAVSAELNDKWIEDIPLNCGQADDDLVISFQVPLREKQVLDVAVRVTDFTNCGTYYEIKSWQVLSTGSWKNDQTLKLLPVTE